MNVSSLKEHVYDVIGAIHEVHRELGPGLNEYCYQEGLEIELTERDIPFLREPVFHPKYHGKEMESTYKLDFLCKGDIIIECKAVVDLANTHRYSQSPTLQLHDSYQIFLWLIG
ncbi:MAG: GxxExxY protein [Alloprevotella sp.]